MPNAPISYQAPAPTYTTAASYAPSTGYAQGQPARQQQSYGQSPAPQSYQTQQVYQQQTYQQSQPVAAYSQHSSDPNVGNVNYGQAVYSDNAYGYNQADNVHAHVQQSPTAGQGYATGYPANDNVGASTYGSQQAFSNQGYAQATGLDAVLSNTEQAYV